MSERRRPYYLITGLVLGLFLGMLYARVLNPPVLINLTPGRLNSADQDQYRLMIALAYQADGDLGRATARLDLLGKNPLADLASQAQRTLATGGSMDDARVLALLAQALAQPFDPPPTIEPSPTDTPLPTDTPPAQPSTWRQWSIPPPLPVPPFRGLPRASHLPERLPILHGHPIHLSPPPGRLSCHRRVKQCVMYPGQPVV
jgi:hypothetical protein